MTATASLPADGGVPDDVEPAAALRELIEEHGLRVHDAPDDSAADIHVKATPGTGVDIAFPFARLSEKGITATVTDLAAGGDESHVRLGIAAEANGDGPFTFADYYFADYIDITYHIDGADWTDNPPEQVALVAGAKNHGRTALARHMAALSPEEYDRFTARVSDIAGSD